MQVDYSFDLNAKGEMIDAFAFNGCLDLESIYIPSSVKYISVDKVFGGCKKLVIFTEEGSNAEQYAKKVGIPFKIVEK